MAMAGVPGDDYPEERTILDLLVASRGDALVSWVKRSGTRRFWSPRARTGPSDG